MNMRHYFSSSERQGPWFVAGLVITLMVAVAFFAVRNVQRERGHMIRSYLEHADAMIWALEAGTRVGMGMHGGNRYVQMMVEETSRQHSIVSMALTDEDGMVLAHSDFSRVGTQLYGPETLQTVTEERKWRIVTGIDGRRVFEVYTYFAPRPDFRPRMWQDGQDCPDGDCLPQHRKRPPRGKAVVFVAQDMHSMDAAMDNELRNNVIIAALVLFMGVGSFVFLVRAEQFRRSRRQLQDARAFATEVVTSLPLGVLSTDPQGRILLANDKTQGMFGSSEPLRGQLLQEVTGLAWQSLLQELDADAQITDRELLLALPQPLPVGLSASRIVNDDGVFLGYLFLFRDLREIRALQEQLQRSERLSALGHLAAGVAHEIRNPLSSIKGFATYLAGKVQGADQEAARTMVQETDRLNRVVSELLEFARPARMALQPTALNAVVERALRLVQSDADARQIQVVFVPEKALPLLALDAERLTQALLNLFLNAVQAMDTHGVLRVETLFDGADKKRVLVRIADTGCGISHSQLAGIFNPYFTTKLSGTGLGLAIVHRIIEAHGADIGVQSEAGQGTLFTLAFPCEVQ